MLARPAHRRGRVRLGAGRGHRRRRGPDLRLDARPAGRGARRRRRRVGRGAARRSPPPGTFEHGASTLQLPATRDDAERWERIRAGCSRPGPRAAAGPGRQGGRRLERARHRRAGRDRRAARPARPGRGCHARRRTCCSTSHLGRGQHGSGGCAGSRGTASSGAHAGVLEDYADVAEGLLALYAVTGDAQLARRSPARLLDAVLDALRATATGGFFDTADDAETRCVRRPQDPTDNATPSGRSAAAGALLTYAALHRVRAGTATPPRQALGCRTPRAGPAHPRFAGWGLAVAEALLDGPREVAVVGAAGDPGGRPARGRARRAPRRGWWSPWGRRATRRVPLLADRPLRGRPAGGVRLPGLRLRRRPRPSPAQLALPRSGRPPAANSAPTNLALAT